ncbi:MAG: glycoside hydrolase family 28 protein [Calditrichaeota bacterium]|nr:glycoside hydrolase family 28 protein [Calditrichota bacterium]
MKSRHFVTLAIVLFVVNLSMAGGPVVFNVRDYGATGKGKILDTQAINQAIDVCAKSGGGTVYFPAGVYLSGSVHLKSNVTLYFDSGAVLKGAPNSMHVYDPPEPLGFKAYQDFGHSHWHNALIWGEKLHDIAIMGPGMIDGGGMSRGNPKPGGGDKTISLKLCRNILIKDITIKHAGHFGILPTGCDNMTIDHIKIDTNRDGINVDCCRNVKISNCSINSPRDDGIVLKSSYALGYNRATEDVTITNCLVSGFKEGTLLDGTFQGGGGTGRIKFGTESNGGFKNITISNCVFDHCRGLALEEVDGGTLENVTISNIAMRDISNSPIFIRLGNRARGPKGTPVGSVRNIDISNVTVMGVNPKYSVLIVGIPGHSIEHIRLNTIRIITDGGGTKEDEKIIPPELEKAYPSPNRFGRMPAYGFFCRHVKDLELHEVSVSFEKKDMRPSLMADDVNGLELDNYRAERAVANEKPIVLKKVSGLFLHDCPNIRPSTLTH